MTPPLILASTSPYRRELLGRLRIAFETVAPDVDETARANESPIDAARRLSHAKAARVAAGRPEAIVIGSDQTATFDGRTLVGKPGSHARARAQLAAASGRAMQFHTGLCVVRPSGAPALLDCVTTTVRFRILEADEIERYLHAEQPYDCAGSAKSEGLGISLLESIDGPDPTALIGLPLMRLCAMLRACGVALP